jgi:hypothetical protein
MTRAEEYKNFVKHGIRPEKRLVCANFGQDWVKSAFNKTTVDVGDYLEAVRVTEVDNFFYLTTDFGKHNPKVLWHETKREQHSDGYIVTETIDTPFGELRRVREMRHGFDPWTMEPAVQTPDDFPKVIWYAEEVAKCAQALKSDWSHEISIINGEIIAAVPLLLPIEMYWMVSYSDQCMIYLDYPDECTKVLEAILESNKILAKAALEAGSDMIVMGSAGFELFSPTVFREAVVPYAKAICSFVREQNGISFYHMCGHSLEVARQGLLNDIHMDVFETFSPPPCGVVKDLAEARSFLNPEICSSGNLPVETLLNGDIEEITRQGHYLADISKNWKHIIGIADTVMSGTKVESIRAFAQSVRSRS